jgi:hypothetical protein
MHTTSPVRSTLISEYSAFGAGVRLRYLGAHAHILSSWLMQLSKLNGLGKPNIMHPELGRGQ